MITLIVLLSIAYSLGSLSSAIIVSKLFNLPDPRQNGSNNPGTTNVLRLGGKLPAVLTLCGDFAKGVIPVILAKMVNLTPSAIGFVGFAAFLGHLFPIFFKFKGGKGVATALGAIFALSPLVGFLVGGAWLTIAVIYRYSSLAALTAIGVAPVALLIFSHAGYFVPSLIMTLLLFWKHQGNIARLRAGTESKIKL